MKQWRFWKSKKGLGIKRDYATPVQTPYGFERLAVNRTNAEAIALSFSTLRQSNVGNFPRVFVENTIRSMLPHFYVKIQIADPEAYTQTRVRTAKPWF